MVFNEAKWPVLHAMANKQQHQDFVASENCKISWQVTPDNYNEREISDFWSFVMDKATNHYFITEPVRKIVYEQDRTFNIIEKEVYDPNYVRPFTGTISYITPQKDLPKNMRNITALIDIAWDDTYKYNTLSFSFYIGNPAIFLGMIGGYFTGNDFHLVIDYGVDSKALIDKVNFFRQFLFFIDHCTENQRLILTTKNRKAKNSSKEKFLNSIDLPIEIIDSTYYTTIVKSEGFKVRGHMRLQPYGKKKKQKKLIWIKDFQKGVVVRKAKKFANE